MRITVTTWLYDWSPTLLHFFLFCGGGGGAEQTKDRVFIWETSFKIIPKPESMG